MSERPAKRGRLADDAGQEVSPEAERTVPKTNVVVRVIGRRTCLITLETRSYISKTKRRVLKRWLFNPVDGVQRRLVDLGIDTSGIDTIVATRLEDLYGLPGLAFAMSDTGGKEVVNIRGPQGSAAFIDAYRPFVRRRHPELVCKDLGSETAKEAKFEPGSEASLLAVTLKPSARNFNQTFCVFCATAPVDDSLKSEGAGGEKESESSDASDDSDLSADEDDEEASEEEEEEEEKQKTGEEPLSPPPLCYVLRFHETSATVVVLDCLPGHVHALTRHPHLRFGRCKRAEAHRPTLVVHLGDAQVVSSSEYETYITKGFPSETRHVFASARENEDFACLGRSNRLAARLRLASPILYPKLRTGRKIQEQNIHVAPEYKVASIDEDEQPQLGVFEEDANALDLEDEEEVVHALEGCAALFLGTGAAKPSVYRGLSSIHVEFASEKGGCLLDCGDDTLSQLRRVTDADRVLRELQFVWISHHHMDHHAGLVALLHARSRLLSASSASPLTIFAPASIHKCLETVMSPGSFVAHPNAIAASVLPAFVRATCLVEHCHDAHAVGLKLVPGISNKAQVSPILIYTGDTRPCELRLKRAFGDDPVELLIHEATFEDKLKASDAVPKRHSTLGEALHVAERLRPRVLVTTHASQRYPFGFSTKQLDMHQKIKESQRLVWIQAHDFLRVPLLLTSLDELRAAGGATDAALADLQLEKFSEKYS